MSERMASSDGFDLTKVDPHGFLKLQFEAFDVDKDNRLSKEEFTNALLERGFEKVLIDPVFEKADTNKDGYLSLEEFCVFGAKLADGSEKIGKGFREVSLNEKLFREVEKNNFAGVKAMLEVQADPEAYRNELGGAAIVMASYTGNASISELLLKFKADPNSDDKIQYRPVSIAARQGNVAVMKQLIESKGDVNWANIDGMTPIIFAAREGHIDAVEALIKAKADVNGGSDKSGSALVQAGTNIEDPNAKWKQKEIEKLLLEAGAKKS